MGFQGNEFTISLKYPHVGCGLVKSFIRVVFAVMGNVVFV